MNPGLNQLHPYPFEKLAKLTKGIEINPERTPISLSIGEPKHTTPGFILDALQGNLHQAAHYPTTKGTQALRETISQWLWQRFHLPQSFLDPDKQVLPVNGTREALFAFAQCVIDSQASSTVFMPNPFYQIYEGAALLAGAEPTYLNCTAENGFIPDFETVPATAWQQCRLLFICSPGNPTGAVIDQATYNRLFELSDRYDFIIAADECYSEIYFDEQQPPLGLLQAAAAAGRDDFKHCVIFHSLSKRSNVPGIRSGFVAGDELLIAEFLRYRTYHGCAMAPYTQAASIVAWQDEEHVIENRRLYKEKFSAVLEILQPVLDVTQPEASFYLWPQTPICDKTFAKHLLTQENVAVLPGSYLSRDVNNKNPGANRIRIALVADHAECIEAAHRIAQATQHI